MRQLIGEGKKAEIPKHIKQNALDIKQLIGEGCHMGMDEIYKIFFSGELFAQLSGVLNFFKGDQFVDLKNSMLYAIQILHDNVSDIDEVPKSEK